MRWPELRAGLVAFAIAIGLVEGCPLPAADDTPDWERAWIGPIRAMQEVAVTPVVWIRTTARVTQHLNMFQASDADGDRFVVEGEDMHLVWHLLYRVGDPEHDAYAGLLDYRRVHGAFDTTVGPPPSYHAFASWFGNYVLADRPDLGAVRMRFEKFLLEPGEVHGTGIYEFPFVVVRR